MQPAGPASMAVPEGEAEPTTIWYRLGFFSLHFGVVKPISTSTAVHCTAGFFLYSKVPTNGKA